MIRPRIPLFHTPLVKRGILALVPLGILHTFSWVSRPGVIDGTVIVNVLAAITGLNLVLFGLLFSKFARYASITLAATYFLHLLYFLLYFVEQRKI